MLKGRSLAGSAFSPRRFSIPARVFPSQPRWYLFIPPLFLGVFLCVFFSSATLTALHFCTALDSGGRCICNNINLRDVQLKSAVMSSVKA